MTTEEVGVIDRVNGVDFLSNMDDLAYKLEQRVLYMRTSDINVCYDDQYIHSIRIALVHDLEKDPERNNQLDSFYLEGPDKGKDKVFYEHMLGKQRGKCKNIHLESGESIKAMLIRYDDEMIRHIEFKKQDDEIIKMGEYVNPPENKPLWHHAIKLTNKQDLIGVFGRTAYAKPANGSQKFSYFVTLGFFVNNCENPRLAKLSHEAGPPKIVVDQQTIYEKVSENQGGLIAAVVILSVILFTVTILCLLRRCGWICQPKQTNFEDASFDEDTQADRDIGAKPLPQVSMSDSHI